MSHVRTQIRERFAQLLDSVATVYPSRVYSLAETELPVLLIFTNSEVIEPSIYTLDRELSVVVEAVAQATESLDVDLDDLIAAVETAIAVDGALAGLATECLPAGIEISMSAEGAQPIGRARITYRVLYRTSSIDPQTAI